MAPTTTRLRGWRFDPVLRLRQAKERLHSSLWFAPAVGTAAALSGAYLIVHLDHELAGRGTWLFDGGPDGARELVSTISSSMLTFTALVFSITILVLQLASAQFSPRVVRTFLQERVTKVALGCFVGTFVYSVAVLSQVRSPPHEFVPAIATWVALMLVLVSVGMFIHYVHRMAHSIRAIAVITKIARDTRDTIDEVYPREPSRQADGAAAAMPPTGPPTVVEYHRDAAGVLTFVDTRALLRLASESDARIAIVPRIGDFVPTGGELLRIWGTPPECDRCCAALAFDIERTLDHDPAFGFRQLVDIAVRAVSPGINDPSTAVQALDHLHDLLRQLSSRDLAIPPSRDVDGVARVWMNGRTYAELVSLAFDEVRDYGATSRQVTRRIEHALLDCRAVATEDKRETLEAQLRAIAAVMQHG